MCLHLIITLPCICCILPTSWILVWFRLTFYYCSYFVQILEEHGPLVAEDPLLVGELENFPSVAQLKIQEAGGFEAFLLESLRFIKMGRCIGLAKHAVSLQQAGHGGCLDDLDDIVDPDTNSESPEAASTSYLNNYSSAETGVYLPNPYVYDFDSGTNLYSCWSNGYDQQLQDPYFLTNDYGNLDLYTCEVDSGGWEMDSSSLTTEENVLKKHAAVQVNTNILLFFLNKLHRICKCILVCRIVYKIHYCFCFLFFFLFILLDMSGDHEECSSKWRASWAFWKLPGELSNLTHYL